ncbi:MAG: hypothetical protein AAGA68_19440 [Pseudomonadota bacterium]
MKHTIRTIGAAVIGLTTFTAAQANDELLAQRTIPGHPCQGANYFNGEQITDYSSLQAFLSDEQFAFWNAFILPEVGVVDHDAEATNALPIDASTPLNRLMALLVIPGLEDFLLRPESVNVPVQDPFIRTDPNDSERKQVPLQSEMESKLNPGTRNDLYARPYTVRRWNRVNGSAELGCYDENSGFVRITANKLFPGIPYSVWSVFSTDKEEYQAPGFPSAAVGMGGAPNFMVADREGRAAFERELGYCPLEIEDPLMYIALLAHFDSELFGTAPTDNTAEFGVGYFADHLCFPTGDYLLDDAGNPLVP